MAPTFPTTFEKEQSPMSPASGSNTPISYRANVNRNKTKKWADAKPVDYGGDDWGDDDEYDPPPPPISKPTGLRQQGQALPSGPPSASTPIDNKKNYGELPPLPGAAGASSSRPRANSFDADDEKRNFSNSTVRQPSPAAEATPAPATRFSQITGVSSTRDPSGPPALSITTQQLPQNNGVAGLRKASQVVSPISGSPHPDILLPGPGRTNTGDSGPAFSGPSRMNTGESGSVYSQPSDIRTPSSDYQARRDFSPTAVPAPLSTTRASPAPQSATDTPSTRFPARKSSLSQSTGPELSQIDSPAQDSAAPKPWVGGRSSSPGAAGRSPTTPSGKALPFIRPADIYRRRVEEERERERQSMDSSRPSMDSLVGAKASDRSDSPAKPPLQEKTSSDSLGGGRQRTTLERDEAPAPGRSLQPMLEPVKERKSEYGFDGFNMNDQAAKAARPTEPTQPPSESTQLDIEEARRSSVSPKLPDLNRMSGFGIDLFSQPKSEEPEPPLPLRCESESTHAPSNITSAPSEDAAPERQPSLGYRSVVNQAFDRKDDSSVPPTPASQTGSGVRRSDSESTGTTGISPIMSRAPSGAVSDVRGRDGATPSILEVVHEPSSPISKEEMSAESQTAEHVIAPGIKPGHRRDIRTPSPGNSPARTPDLAKTEAVAQGHEAVIANPSSPDTIMPANDEEPLQPPRPINEREGSFRPSLPGGWTSYATTARSETPQQDSTRVSKEVERTQTPTGQTSSARGQPDGDDYDITPTTTKHSLPPSALGAAAGAAFGGETGAALGRHDKDSPVGRPVSENPMAVRGSSALPTPDPAMAPSGTLYSSAPLDSRLMPKLESVSPETQLRPVPVQTEPSTDSSDAPTPPAKDIPVLEDVESFPKPTVPLKQRTIDQVEEDEKVAPPMRPQVLPTLSTDTRPQDEESDKLRKEIIKSLSPKPSDATPPSESLQPDQLDDQTTSNDGRYSYLPREYDNYWASTSEDAAPASMATSTAQKAAEDPVQSEHPVQSEAPAQDEAPPAVTESPTTDIEPPPIPPLSARRTSMAAESRLAMPNRFSWETSAEDVSLTQSREEVPEVPAIPPHQEPYTDRTTEEPMKAMDEGVATESTTHAAQVPYSQTATLDYDKELGAQGLTSPVSEASDDEHTRRDAALLAGSAALGGAAVAAAVQSHPAQSPQQSTQPQRRLSLAEEKDPRVSSSSYPVSPTPPEDEHPSRSPQAYFSSLPAEQPAPSAAPSSVSPINSPVKTQFSPTPRILTFMEIAAIKNPHQRIQTFDEMRHRFAAMDSGLIDWMATLKAQHPEHANVTGSWSGAAFPIANGSARSKYPKTTGQALPPLQQPYYQQYLNASPTTPGTPVSRPGPSIPSGSQQGFSPTSSGKLTSQQVQAKGKELLHTAGIFGGKAGKAGKGLLAKGKNKLRGSGAGDKTSLNLSPPAKPKNERRTSWGFPLSVSRSSGRSDASARQSGEGIPMPTPTPERQRAGTMNSQRSFPTLEIPTSSSRDSPRLMSGAVVSPESQMVQSNEATPSRGLAEEATENPELEERDQLGIPAPITKNQPSWDPFNATPIAEEEGFQYDERPKQQAQAMHSTAPPKALAIPEAAGSKIERSNSGEAQFYDAHEEPSDLNDWVMVSPEPELKQVQPKAEPVPRPESEVYQPPEGPPPGFLERQQTQPVAEPSVTKAPEQPPTSGLNQPPLQTKLEQKPRPESEIYQPPEGPPPGFLNRQQAQPVPEPQITKAPEQQRTDVVNQQPQVKPEVSRALEDPPQSVLNQQQVQPKLEPEVSRVSEEHPTSVLNRPRFSYEAPIQSQAPGPTYQPQSTSHYSPTQQNFVHTAREQQYHQQEVEEPTRSGSFKGLPPIRRTSTFGLGFGRKQRPRFPIDDEELSSPQSQHEAASKNYEAEIGAAAGAAAVAAYANERDDRPHQVHHTAASTANLSQQRKDSMDQPSATRPELNQAHSSDYSQRTVKPQSESQPAFQAPRAADIPPEGFRRSQDAWRPNAVSPPTQISPTRYNGTAMAPPQRPSMEQQRSMEGQRSRGFSESSQSTARPDIQYFDRGPRPVQNQPLRPMLYDQPPSSAQRYPELFQTQQQPLANLGRDGELPTHLYQAPIPREATFLPRQQTNEYQLPGVGPPAEEPHPDRSRRNSATFLKDLVRGTSRERGNSLSRDGGMSPSGRAVDSRGYEYPESSVASDEAQEQQKRRSSFFGNLNRASTTGLGPPQSRESVVAHFPGSRTDLQGTPQQSPVGPHDKKRSFFGSASPSSPKLKSNKLSRSSTSGMSDEPGKKKRFSGLSSMFSRSGNPSSKDSGHNRPQATRELSYNERQPIESPQFDQRQTVRQPPPPQNQNQNVRGPSQQRQLLTRLSTGGDPSKPRQESKTRRPSTSTLLSGIMGRKSEQKDRGKEDSSSQGTRSQASQPQYPQQIPLGQTYTDLQEESPQAPSGPHPPRIQQPQPLRYQERPPQPQPQPQERGRRASREPQREIPREPPLEPQYDRVPIPGGYSLVRGEGAMTIPTEYDPRGLSRFQQSQQIDPQYMQQQQMRGPYQQAPQGPPRQKYEQQPESRRTSNATKPPTLSAVETYESYTKRQSPRLSREDILARSPAREQPGQQRPYQLSLPEDEEDRDHRPNRLSKSPPILSPANSTRPAQNPNIVQPQIKKQHDAIQRLQQPVLRHPESPAGYPLPDDAVFSPVNEAARDIPPPPPPKWPSHLDAQHGHNPNQHLSSQHLNLESQLDRSNTRRTAVSAVSGMSGPQSAGLNVPRKEDDGGREGLTPSPTPPSPAYTPERTSSPPRYSVDEKELERELESGHQDRGRMLGDQNIRTTTVNRGPSPDLYSASPRLSPLNSGSNAPPNARNGNLGNGNGHATPSAQNQRASQPLQQTGSSAFASSGKENNPTTLAKAKSKKLAELENTESDTHRARRAANAHEEKIYYDAETGQEGHGGGEEGDEDGDGVIMSATSYPGQEWMPIFSED